MKLMTYKSPQEILAAHWHIPVEELLEGTMGGFDENGAETEVEVFDILEGMKETGFWGFADQKNKEVHVWVSSDADVSDVIFFLGHEVGHTKGKQVEGEDFNSVEAEELRANEYGEAAQQAYLWAKELLQ